MHDANPPTTDEKNGTTVITKAKPVKIHFPEAQGRTFLEAIMLRGNCLPARVSEPADLIRLKELKIGYSQPNLDATVDPKAWVKLTNAVIPEDWRFYLVSAEYLVIKDQLGIPWLTITEDDGAPVLSVRPLYGWKVGNIDRKAGTFDLDIFHPHGGVDSSQRRFHPEVRSRTLHQVMEEVAYEVRDLYTKKGYAPNWRQLGASTPMPS